MRNDSTTFSLSLTDDEHMQETKSAPRLSTLIFIRQFARVCNRFGSPEFSSIILN